MRSKSAESTIAKFVHANCSGRHGCSSPIRHKSLANRVIAWLAAAGEEVPQSIPEPTAARKRLPPVSVETLVR